MEIQIVTPGETLGYALTGSLLTLALNDAELTTDLAAEQADTTRQIEIRTDGTSLSRTDGDTYAALITIPPRRYRAGIAVTKPADGGGETEQTPTPVALPLDGNAITLQLWGMNINTNQREA
ncbi:hypothetical protein EGI20_18415 [Aquitalea sp. S1-19]|nr:hypothetical protein [Aquitalea sp. S1-19]MCP9760933.1 hypothetical protein [Aquitalea sp. S1-19]MCP9761194.1 hypothetical protein [Aquitalea sp. S1-19]